MLYCWWLPPIKVVDLAPAKVTTFFFAFRPIASRPRVPQQRSMKTIEPQHVTDGPALATSGLVHRVWEPSNPGPHPTVVMVHGRSGSEDVMWIFKRATPAEWLLVAPRAPLTDPRGGYSWDVRGDGQWPQVDDLLPGAVALLDFIHALPDLYGADEENLYLMGFSQGAAVSLVAAMQQELPLRGIASLVGFMPPVDAPAARGLAGLPVHMSVGLQDKTVPLRLAQRTAKSLIDVGAHLDYRTFDTGHRLNAAGMRDLTVWWQQRAAAELPTP